VFVFCDNDQKRASRSALEASSKSAKVLDRTAGKRDAGSPPGYKSFHQTDRRKTMDGMLITIVGLMAAAPTSLFPTSRK